MKEPYREGLTSRPDLESCTYCRETAREALTEASAGQVFSREIRTFGVPTLLSEVEGIIGRDDKVSPARTPRGRRPCACAKPSCARTGRSQGHSSQVERRVAWGRPEAERP